MKKLRLSNYDSISYVSELQEYEIGQIVTHNEAGPGVIAALITEDTVWYPEPEDDDSEVEITASESEPVYIIALMEGGSIPADPSDFSEGGDLEGDGEDITSFDDVDNSADETELAPIYSYMDDPNSMEDFENARLQVMREQLVELQEEREELAPFRGDELSYEQLLNIPGVDDPEVGFASDPNGWTRKSYLQAWATVGATWRSCFARMIRHFGPNMAKRWCAALKDEILGTERWRNRF